MLNILDVILKKNRTEIFEIFPWNKNFNTGIDIIDEQHKRLVNILNTLAYNLASRADKEILTKLFDELVDYTIYHFQTEENIWSQHLNDNDIFSEHKKTHHSFINKIQRLRINKSNKTIDENIHDAITFLTRWLAFHILDNDKKLAKIVILLEKGYSQDSAIEKSQDVMNESIDILINTVLGMYNQLSSRTLDLSREISKREKIEEQLNFSKDRLTFVLTNHNEKVWDWDIKNNKGENDADKIFKILKDAHQIQNTKIHPSDIELLKKDFMAHLEGKTEFYSNKHRRVNNDGSWSWIFSRGKIVNRDQNNKPTRIVGTHTDITEKELADLIYKNSSQGMFVVDTNIKIIGINPAFTQITGFNSEDVIGKNPNILSSGLHKKAFYQDMWKHLIDKGSWGGEIWNKKKNGEIYPESISINSVKSNDGKIDHYLALFTDITEKKNADKKIFYYAQYDILTGLPNRALFTKRFKQAILNSKKSHKSLAVCFLDLDDFKPINDNHGHDFGDLLLIDVGKRIKKIIKKGDSISRLGGDEFALLLNNINSKDQAIEYLKNILESISRPFNILNFNLRVTASIGVTFYPDDMAQDSDQLLRHADQAMYLAKLEGKNKLRVFNAIDNQLNINIQAQKQRISQALVNKEFRLYYQPKVNMLTGEVFGVEALIRWRHPKKGIVLPLDFLPLIDKTNIEIELGEFVIMQAVKQIYHWQQHGINLQVSINISVTHLQSDSFFEHLKQALNKYHLQNTNNLQLEILESSDLGDLDSISDIINVCKNDIGVNIALDDFGTGYSSLSHIRNLSPNTIKIDQTFVQDMLDDPDDAAIIDGVIGLADSFNLDLIAEGVESVEHGEMLILMGCINAQGYIISHPIPAKNISKWLINYKPNKTWLKYSQLNLNKNQNRIKIFKLTTTRWKNKFVENILSYPEDIDSWPIMDPNKCPCGMWINRAIQDKLFKKKSIKLLDKSHQKLHKISENILALYQKEEFFKARSQLPLLSKTFDEMIEVLKQCKLKS